MELYGLFQATTYRNKGMPVRITQAVEASRKVPPAGLRSASAYRSWRCKPFLEGG